MAKAYTPATGEAAPDFAVADSTGTLQRLSKMVATKPHVLLFYRGPW
ncbi:MAG: hypothetical protein ABR543_06475 [Gemmatimonadaceae bacterium]